MRPTLCTLLLSRARRPIIFVCTYNDVVVWNFISLVRAAAAAVVSQRVTVVCAIFSRGR